MKESDAERAVERQANELYWNSDRSVNGIAADLDLSKGVLYGMIHPLDADAACPICGTGVVFPNRTARDQGLVTCPGCGWEGEEDDAPPRPEGATERDADEDSDPTLPARREEELFDFEYSRTIWGGALIGAALGVAVLLWARRR